MTEDFRLFVNVRPRSFNEIIGASCAAYAMENVIYTSQCVSFDLVCNCSVAFYPVSQTYSVESHCLVHRRTSSKDLPPLTNAR